VCCGADQAEIDKRADKIGRPPANIDLAGTPQECVDKLAEFANLGARRAYLQVLDMADLDHVRLIAAEVMPHVASL
jgi:alkanesulfonate monooxygenase SsuD/methylene tetrahydromethanopterin reductase-like flavin-dependent oxidoreductase (luciferase family)